MLLFISSFGVSFVVVSHRPKGSRHSHVTHLSNDYICFLQLSEEKYIRICIYLAISALFLLDRLNENKTNFHAIPATPVN